MLALTISCHQSKDIKLTTNSVTKLLIGAEYTLTAYFLKIIITCTNTYVKLVRLHAVCIIHIGIVFSLHKIYTDTVAACIINSQVVNY